MHWYELETASNGSAPWWAFLLGVGIMIGLGWVLARLSGRK